MKTKLPFVHRIEERTLKEIRAYFKPEVFIEYCKACNYYSRIWMCPPYDFDASRLLEDFRYVYILGSKLYIDDLREDLRAYVEYEDAEYASNEIYKAARVILDDGLMSIEAKDKHRRVLLAGRCMICSQCTREQQTPCIYPDKARLSLESIGFDVASICSDVLGDQLQWAKEKLPEYFLLISAVFSREKLDKEELVKQMI